MFGGPGWGGNGGLLLVPEVGGRLTACAICLDVEVDRDTSGYGELLCGGTAAPGGIDRAIGSGYLLCRDRKGD